MSAASAASPKIICGRLKSARASVPASKRSSDTESHESALSRVSLSKSLYGRFRVSFKIALSGTYDNPMPWLEIEQTGCHKGNKRPVSQGLFGTTVRASKPLTAWEVVTRGVFKLAAACGGVSDSARRQSSGSMLLVLYVTKSTVARMPVCPHRDRVGIGHEMGLPRGDPARDEIQNGCVMILPPAERHWLQSNWRADGHPGRFPQDR